MYHKVNIQKLSANQIAKLLRGHRIRVKHGQGHTVNLSAEQAKKVMSAHRKGCGCCVTFDPYQQEMHRGEGFFDVLKSGVKALTPVAVSAGKAVAPVLIDAGTNALKDYVAGKGVAKRSAPPRRRGRGVASNLFKKVAPVLVDVGADALKGAVSGGALYNAGYSAMGEGKKKRGKKGKGAIGGVIGQTLGDIFLPF